MSSSTPVGTPVKGGGTVPGKTDDTEKLDEAVAKVLGLSYEIDPSDGKSLYFVKGEDGKVASMPYFPCHDIASNWNALMAAVAKLEKNGPWLFHRDHPCWEVWTDKNSHGMMWDKFTEHCFGDGEQTEALALARCIAAVVGENESG